MLQYESRFTDDVDLIYNFYFQLLSPYPNINNTFLWQSWRSINLNLYNYSSDTIATDAVSEHLPLFYG